ncbi:hypothetical protein MKW92_013985 [Papaver armeniacum]|nr:hypothetical protein MKW92_013985 [Papaver armeniacum]
MNSHGDEEAPLVVSDGKKTNSLKNHTRDVHILSSSFLLIFLAYGAAQNLQSTVNTAQDLGTTTLGILYVSFTFFSLFASTTVRMLGSKNALILGSTGYWLYVAANLIPSWYSMVPAALYLGFCASIFWVGEVTYLTSTARSHAKDYQLHDGTIIGSFNGVFFRILCKSPGAFFNEGSTTGTTLLFVVFLGFMTFGSLLMCFLSKRDDDGRDRGTPKSSTFLDSVVSLWDLVVAPLLDKRMLLIIPLIAYSGLQQAFVWAEFTKEIVKPALGVSGVGGSMAVYGVFDAILVVLLWILLGYSATTGVLGYVHPLLMAAMLGVGDGIFNTHASIAVMFFLYPHITLQAMILIMIASLILAVVCFLFLTLHLEKAFSSSRSSS